MSEKALPPTPPITDDETRALKGAGEWLRAATVSHVRAFGLGEERRYSFDQATGTLTLHHAGGRTLALAGRIVGSFRPRDRSFRWAWANSGVEGEMAAAARSVRERMGHMALGREPSFAAPFALSTQLAAMAARGLGCDGVYRCVDENHLTIFVGYTAPPGDGGDDVDPGAAALVDAYDAEMLPLDAMAYGHPASADDDAQIDREAFGRALAAKNEVHARYWRAKSDEWAPTSAGWPSDHDPATRTGRFAAPRRAGGAYVVTLRRTGCDAHVLRCFEDGWRIVDLDLGWGRGLLLA